MKKIVIVAQDIAPSKAGNTLIAKLAAAGITHTAFINNGGANFTDSAAVAQAVGEADAVFVGMSSSEGLAAAEIAAVIAAQKKGIPIFMYADAPGVHNRPWFKPYMLDGVTMFHINEKHASLAREAHGKIVVITTGSPDWETFFTPKLNRSAVRERLGLGMCDRMVLAPGCKSGLINSYHFTELVGALDRIYDTYPVTLVISIHGGDLTDPAIYMEIVKYSGWVKVRVVPGAEFSGLDMVPGADLVIQTISTIGTAAACQGIPTIELNPTVVSQRLKEATGSADPELSTEGCAICVPQGVNLPSAIIEMFERPQMFRDAYARCFHRPTKGGAVAAMVEAIKQRLA